MDSSKFIIIFIVFIFGVKADIFWEQVLTNDLTSDIEKFNPGVGPWTPQHGKNQSRTKINVQLEIFGIKEIDLMSSTVKLSCAFRQWWNDSRLVWDPKQYGGIEKIYLKTDGSQPAGWISDLIIREDSGEGMLSSMKFTDQRCTYTGLCYYSRLGEIAVQTTFNLERFPYDQQEVKLTIESWIHDATRLQVGLHTIPMKVKELSSFVAENIEWQITANNSYEVIQDYGDSGVYYRVIYAITIQRQGATMLVSILIPGALITFLGLMYYILPVGNGERVDYLATILLTEVMFLVMITSSVPLSKAIPQVGLLFLGYTVLLAALMFVTLFIDKFHQVNQQIREKAQKLKLKEEKLKKNYMLAKQSQIIQTGLKQFSSKQSHQQNRSSSDDLVPDIISDVKVGYGLVNEDWTINPLNQSVEIKTKKKDNDKIKKFITLLDLALFIGGIFVFIVLTALKFSILF